MHPINLILKPLGLGVHRLRQMPKDFMRSYQVGLERARHADSGFQVIENCLCDLGHHPVSYKEFECGFAASSLAKHRPATVLDIGSYREFVLGLSSAYHVTSLDVRPLPKVSANESIVVGDAKKLSFPDASFDAVVSLSSIEHFGLGRYGDEFDLEGDAKAMREMKRCVRAGGLLIVTTTLTGGPPVLAFNGHRIYSLEMIHALCAPWELVEESFFSHRLGRFCEFKELSRETGVWEVYCGCWRKPQE